MARRMAGFRNGTPSGKSEAFWRALRIVERSGRKSAILVPLCPNRRMRVAGAVAGEVDERTAARIYQAMIAASDKAGPA